MQPIIASSDTCKWQVGGGGREGGMRECGEGQECVAQGLHLDACAGSTCPGCAGRTQDRYRQYSLKSDLASCYSKMSPFLFQGRAVCADLQGAVRHARERTHAHNTVLSQGLWSQQTCTTGLFSGELYKKKMPRNFLYPFSVGAALHDIIHQQKRRLFGCRRNFTPQLGIYLL